MDSPILGFDGEYRWLSNFYHLQYPIDYAGITFKTAENMYQAMKCVRIEDVRYISYLSPGQAKRVGKLVEIDPLFEDNKVAIMDHILRIKFNQPKFKSLLLSTGNRYIEETNTWGDTFWGVCNGVGENNLGKLIMNIRAEMNLCNNS